MNSKRLAVLGFGFSLLSTMVGCAAPAGDDIAENSGAAEELRSADCPRQIEVEVDAPEIPSDDALDRTYVKDFQRDGDPNPTKSAVEQVSMLAPFLAVARADKAVSLKGTVAQGCAYRTVDAITGEPSSHHVWLAKSTTPSGDQLSLRMEQSIGRVNDVLFFSVPLKSVSPTSLVVDTSKSGRVFGEDTSNGHDGSDGFSIWIGNVHVTARVAK